MRKHSCETHRRPRPRCRICYRPSLGATCADCCALRRWLTSLHGQGPAIAGSAERVERYTARAAQQRPLFREDQTSDPRTGPMPRKPKDESPPPVASGSSPG